jgi:hypothetical protein
MARLEGLVQRNAAVANATGPTDLAAHAHGRTRDLPGVLGHPNAYLWDACSRTVRVLAGPVPVHLLRDYVEVDSVHESVIIDRARVSSALTERLAVLLARSAHVCPRHTRERHHLDRIDLDACRPDGVATSHLDLGATPQPERDGDPAGGHPRRASQG